MDKFDQWYNKKMDEQDLAYSESSWDAFSQQLNQLPGSRKGRRPFMYVWILALSVIVGAGGIFVWQSSNSSSSEQETIISTEEENSPVSPPANNKSEEYGEAKSGSQPLAAHVLPDMPASDSEAAISGIETKPAVSNKNQLAKADYQPRRIVNKAGQPSLLKNDTGYDNDQKELKTTIGEPENEISIAEDPIKLAESNSSKNPSSDALLNSTEPFTEETEIASGKESLKSLEANSIQSLSVEQTKNQLIAPLAIEIRTLEQSVPELTKASFLNSELYASEPAIVDCCPYKGWSHQVEAGAQFFPGVNEGSRFFTGLQTAYHLQFRWAQRWSASAGAGVLQRWGSFGGFKDSPQDIYTNTKVRRGFLLVPTSATYLQLPLMMNFHAGKHIVSAGVRTHLLIGVKGQLDEYQLQRSANEADISFSSSRVNSGWINDSGFRTIVPEYLITYGYQLNSHWSVSISCGWMPNGIVFADEPQENLDILSSLAFDSGSSQQPFLLEDKWQAGISVRYKF